MNLLVTEQERSMISEKYSKLIGDKIKTRVVDLEQLGEYLRKQRKANGLSLFIDIKPIRVDKYKDINYSFSFVKDRVTGVHFGIPSEFHPDGQIKWVKIPMNEFVSLNLNNAMDMNYWIVIRMHPKVKDSPFDDGDPIFYVHDPEQEATQKIYEAEQVQQAILRATEIKKNELVNFARYIGLHLESNVSDRIIRSMIMQAAVNQPVFFNQKYEDPNRKIHEVVKNAEQLGIIRYSIDKGYNFKNLFLGNSEYEVLRYMLENTMVLSSIANETRNIDKLGNKMEEESQEEDEKPKKQKKEKD
jgi:hypothetical protein